MKSLFIKWMFIFGNMAAFEERVRTTKKYKRIMLVFYGLMEIICKQKEGK